MKGALAMWDPYAEFRSETLPNGLTVYAAHWPERPWEAMVFIVHSGAEHDPVGLEGLSHFIEHTVSENTIIPKKDIKIFFEDKGGSVNLGTTGYPSTHYKFFAPADGVILSNAFSIFGHMLISAKLEKFIERERQVIIFGEFPEKYPTKISFDMRIRERKMVYSGYWLERFAQPFGSPESVEKITKNDLQAHYDSHYTPANISIVGVGGMTLEKLINLISESPFNENKKGARTPLPNPAVNFAPLSEIHYVFESSKHIKMEVPRKSGAYRSIAKIPGNTNFQTLRILAEMLDDALNEEVRERRAWAYDIYSSRYYFRHFYEFSVNCDSLAVKALDKIEEVIEVCIASMIDREDLFNRIKQRALAMTLMVDVTAHHVRNLALDHLSDYQRIISLAETRDKIEKATMDDIRNLLQWLKPERRWTLIVRP